MQKLYHFLRFMSTVAVFLFVGRFGCRDVKHIGNIIRFRITFRQGNHISRAVVCRCNSVFKHGFFKVFSSIFIVFHCFPSLLFLLKCLYKHIICVRKKYYSFGQKTFCNKIACFCIRLTKVNTKVDKNTNNVL